ncbi:MAG: PTS fructose transporter subunit IIA [Gemmatimonadota bacterium]|nr:MAG: PTS fructose transporter subunit IIA [Gemmatimonadota bacterium]
MPVAVEELLSFFDEARFVPSLRARTKAGVLKELANALSNDEEIRHPDVLQEALEAREKLGSTGIGKDVAIPHSRTLSVPKLKALVARSKKGIDWGSADGKPVKLFFVVVAPPQERTNQYLPLLGALVSGMQLKPNREAVATAKNWEGVITALESAFRG